MDRRIHIPSPSWSLDLAEPERFETSGQTYGGSPEYRVLVDRVTDHTYPLSGLRTLRLAGQRVLKSGKPGGQRVTLTLVQDDVRVPVEVRDAADAARAYIDGLRAVVAAYERTA